MYVCGWERKQYLQVNTMANSPHTCIYKESKLQETVMSAKVTLSPTKNVLVAKVSLRKVNNFLRFS